MTLADASENQDAIFKKLMQEKVQREVAKMQQVCARSLSTLSISLATLLPPLVVHVVIIARNRERKEMIK